ncbi:MAG: polysaccharide lyase, partial [Prosthecobacter sp.]
MSPSSFALRHSFLILISSFVIPPLAAAATPAEVSAATIKAVSFYHSHAASHGGYVYRYSADFTLREAEGIPGPDTIWIQPPGTPAVGMAMLDAYEATKDEKCLAAAVEAARCVSRTQLASGGWDYSGHFDAKGRESKNYCRKADGTAIPRTQTATREAGWHNWRRQDKKNYATYDDDVSQAATRLLVRVDHALGGKDAEIKAAADFALHTLLMTQYPAGGWSANFDDAPTAPPPVEKYPIKPASYPADWPRKWPKDFTGCYVLNDNTHATLMSTLLLAWQLRGDPKYLEAAKRGGDFLLLAQMPDPQPAWAQQY